MLELIFLSNILRALDEKGMKKKELAKHASVSSSFFTDITTGKGNPSLKTMESISSALEIPLSVLLTSSDLTSEDLALLAESEGKKLNITEIKAPPGYEWVEGFLPKHQAFIVKKWINKNNLK